MRVAKTILAEAGWDVNSGMLGGRVARYKGRMLKKRELTVEKVVVLWGKIRVSKKCKKRTGAKKKVVIKLLECHS